jgi:hypothetical protein
MNYVLNKVNTLGRGLRFELGGKFPKVLITNNLKNKLQFRQNLRKQIIFAKILQFFHNNSKKAFKPFKKFRKASSIDAQLLGFLIVFRKNYCPACPLAPAQEVGFFIRFRIYAKVLERHRVL